MLQFMQSEVQVHHLIDQHSSTLLLLFPQPQVLLKMSKQACQTFLYFSITNIFSNTWFTVCLSWLNKGDVIFSSFPISYYQPFSSACATSLRWYAERNDCYKRFMWWKKERINQHLRIKAAAKKGFLPETSPHFEMKMKASFWWKSWDH